MQTKTKINASVEEVYNTLILSVITETKQACGKDISEKQLCEGFKYHHKINQGKKVVDTTVHVRKPVENKNIHISVSYPDKTIDLDYLLEKAESNSTMLTCTQTDSKFKNESFLEKLFFQKSIKRKFKKIEKYIISQRT